MTDVPLDPTAQDLRARQDKIMARLIHEVAIERGHHPDRLDDKALRELRKGIMGRLADLDLEIERTGSIPVPTNTAEELMHEWWQLLDSITETGDEGVGARLPPDSDQAHRYRKKL